MCMTSHLNRFHKELRGLVSYGGGPPNIAHGGFAYKSRHVTVILQLVCT